MLGLRVAASVYEHKLEQDDDQMRMRASVVELHEANHKNAMSSYAGYGAADATLSVHLHGLGKLVAANLGAELPSARWTIRAALCPRPEGGGTTALRPGERARPLRHRLAPGERESAEAAAHHDARHQHGVPTTPACTYMLAETANALGADFHDPYHGGLIVYVCP